VDICGEDFKKNFEEASSKTKIYRLIDCAAKIVKSFEEFNSLEGDNLNVIIDVENGCDNWPRTGMGESENVISFFQCDFRNINKIKIKGDVDVVDFCQAKNLNGFLDLSDCSKVDFTFCNLELVDHIKFKAKSDINFYCIPDDFGDEDEDEDEEYYLPRNLDVSMCKHVDFDGRNFRSVENFVWSKNTSFSTDKTCCLPEDFEKHNRETLVESIFNSMSSIDKSK
jgi:hypothetical protein